MESDFLNFTIIPKRISKYKKGEEIFEISVRKDLLTKLLSARDPEGSGESMDDKQVRDEAKTLLATLEERVPTLTIVVTGVPGRTPVEVTLDGRKLTSDELAAPLQLAPGKYNVIAKADELGLAIELGCDAADIGLTIHPHPTLSESVGMAAEVYEGTITDLYVPKKK